MSGRRWAILSTLAVVLVVSAAVVLGQTAAKMVSERSDEKVTKPKSTGASSANNRTLCYGESTFKGDLLDALKKPPQLVVLGGSRAQRFEPNYIRRLTGLSAFNFALQNGRPEDAYATSKYLFSRAPDVKLRCFYAIQATTFGDRPMHPGLLYDERFSQWFPPDLVSRQKELNGPPSVSAFHRNGTARGVSCSTTSTTRCSRADARRSRPARLHRRPTPEGRSIGRDTDALASLLREAAQAL